MACKEQERGVVTDLKIPEGLFKGTIWGMKRKLQLFVVPAVREEGQEFVLSLHVRGERGQLNTLRELRVVVNKDGVCQSSALIVEGWTDEVRGNRVSTDYVLYKEDGLPKIVAYSEINLKDWQTGTVLTEEDLRRQGLLPVEELPENINFRASVQSVIDFASQVSEEPRLLDELPVPELVVA